MPDAIEIRVTDFPVNELEELRGIARKSGVPDTNTAVVKWAAIQWLLDQRKQLQPQLAN